MVLGQGNIVKVIRNAVENELFESVKSKSWHSREFKIEPDFFWQKERLELFKIIIFIAGTFFEIYKMKF